MIWVSKPSFLGFGNSMQVFRNSSGGNNVTKKAAIRDPKENVKNSDRFRFKYVQTIILGI